jgi:hypothetical protein
MQHVILLDLSADQESPMGRVLHKAHYGTGQLAQLVDTEFYSSGYPHNGGVHTLCLKGAREDLIAWMELFQQYAGYPQFEVIAALNVTAGRRVEAKQVAPLLYRARIAEAGAGAIAA